jgi:hypothetical protein
LLAVGAIASSVSADVLVRGMLSTGQTFGGKLLRDDGRRLSVKGEKRTYALMAANVVQCTIRLSDEKPPPDVQIIPQGRFAKFLLTKGHKFLAESLLLCALTRTVRTGPDGEVTLMLWAMERALDRKPVTPAQTKAYKMLYTATRQNLPVRLGGVKTRAWRPRRYQLASPRSIEAALKKMDDWGGRMKQIAPKTHRIETPHFFIYSSWPAGDDARLKGIYEKLYTALCKQFDVPVTDNIWIGKLPVFALWEKSHFVTFSIDVAGISDETAKKAGGFAGYRGQYQFVNLGPVMRKGMSKTQARTWFYELLVHESTHVFLMRYISYRHIDSWLNEGIAEMLASTFVPQGGTSRKLKAAHALVKKGKSESFLPMFTAEQIPIESTSYGAAQSLARFLVFKGKSKFVELVHKIKSGADSEKALEEVYGLTYEKLLQQWARQVR